MRIMVLSDTHVPRSVADMPKQVYEEINNVDMIIHAGDFVEKELFDKIKSLKETRSVCGNMDSSELQHLLNQKEVLQIGKFKIGIIHGYGGPRDIIDNVQKEFSDVDVIIFGHSHTPVNMIKDGMLFFNPGSPTDTVFATSNFYGVLEVGEDKIEGKIVKI
jgi:hypothetical protein